MEPVTVGDARRTQNFTTPSKPAPVWKTPVFKKVAAAIFGAILVGAFLFSDGCSPELPKELPAKVEYISKERYDTDMADLRKLIEQRPSSNLTGLEPTEDGMIMDNGAINYDALLNTLKADLASTTSTGGVSKAEILSIWTEIAEVKDRIKKLQRR